ncbi:MAG: leucyl aminopeptidase [Planctomycetaceae bacterium]
MECQLTHQTLQAVAADWLIIGMPQGAELSESLAGLDRVLEGQLTRLREAGDLTGKLGEALTVPDVPPLSSKRLLIVGLGPLSEINRGTLQRAFVTAALSISRKPGLAVACLIPDVPQEQVRRADVARELSVALSVGCAGPGLYQKEPKRHAFRSVTFVVPDTQSSSEVDSAVAAGAIIGEAVNLVRELVNRPASDVHPETFATRAAQVAGQVGMRCEVFDEGRLRQERMGSLLAVAAGSSRPPRVVLFRYQGAGAEKPVTGLVGKGVTFDSGGLSLKQTDSMSTMKCDMAGAAAVLGVMTAAARLKLPVNLLGAVGLVENMVSGTSYKLGDVLTARNGTTIEVLNTDAEGRLVLADVLSYVADQKVDRMIDLATLTGSCVVALGEDITGAFTNNQLWCDEVLAAAQAAGEPIWQLPMHDFFDEQLKSEVADLKNVGKRWGGASIAARFLQHFVGECPWVHLDIAGPAFADSSAAHRDSGGSGVMVRTLVELLARTAGE